MLRFPFGIIVMSLILLIGGILAICIYYSQLEPVPLENESLLAKTGKLHSELNEIQLWLNQQETLLQEAKQILAEKKQEEDKKEIENNKLANILPPELDYLAPVIIEEAEKYNLDPLYVVSIIKKESGFNPNLIAYNKEPFSQDMGLMQINCGTLPDLAPALGFPATEETALDPIKNIQMGCYYLGKHLETYNGDLHLVATRYNAGPRGANAGRNAYSISVMEQYRHYQEVILSAD